MANTLDLEEGRFNTTTNASAVLKLCEVSGINKGSYTRTNGFINGPIEVELDNGVDFTFPVGKGTTYKSIGITNTSGQSSAQSWTAEYYAEGAINEATIDSYDVDGLNSTVKHMNQSEYWRINTGTATVDNVTLDGSDVITDSDKDFIHVMYWGGAHWDDLEGSASGSEPNIAVISGKTVSFSEKFFTFGSTDDASPLPVELLYFTGESTTNGVSLEWATASEVNNQGFELQRSYNGKDFTVVSFINGVGNSHIVKTYEYVDEAAPSADLYYRLKQVDYDGAFEYHPTIFLPKDGGSAAKGEMTVYPNPLNSEGKLSFILLSRTGDVSVKLIGMDGSVLYEQTISSEVARNMWNVSIPDAVPAGTYMVLIATDKEVFRERVIK